jgi:two-component system cell cycle sensor histidine kinase/response regulator CckA
MENNPAQSPATAGQSGSLGSHVDNRLGRGGLVACVTVLLALAPVRLGAAEASAAPPPVETITDPSQIWPLSTEMRSVVHPLRIEGRVSYYDPHWHNSWFEKDGVGTYLKLSPSPPALRTGQYVRIEGSLLPSKGLDANTVTVTVLKEFAPIEPLPAKGRIRDSNALSARIVTADAYVDGQQLMDDDHVRLALVIDDRPAIGWVKPDDPQSVPNWQGRFVRLNALYSARFDTSGTETTIELWVGRQSDLTVLGSLDDYVDFKIPQTRINEIYQAPIGQMIRVRGRVQAHEPGSSMVIRDHTGQIVVRSVQQQRFPFGTEVEAVGRLAIAGPQWILQSAVYRRAALPASANPSPPGRAIPIETVERIRQLTTKEAARGYPVAISGTVTWALPDSDFFFLQDVSGGIRVRFPRDKLDAPPLAQNLAVEGVTYDGGHSPAVELRHYTDLGAMSAPPAKPVTFEQAITGKEDGQWVEMRGFYQSTVSQGQRRLIYVTTPAGEFVADLRSPVNFETTPGSLINVLGVCEAAADENGHITGLTLRVPYLHSISIVEDAPVDIYGLPLRSIKALEQLSTTRDMMRVRIFGVVSYVVPGRVVYVQEDDAGLLVLSHETAPLAAGDAIEAVGILGREGVRTLLREAVYRKRGTGSPPTPLLLVDPSRLSTAFDARLVRVRGTLIDALRRPERTRLTLQSGNTLFEAVLDPSPGTPALTGLALGAGLELTGIYRSIFGDSRQLRGFQLQLRSPLDVVVVQKPRFLTAERALIAVAFLGGCIVIGLAWITALRRRVRQQTEQIRRQLEHQARLEAEVQHAARLESLGVLAGGIAHDFNNLLTIILGNLGLAMLNDKVRAAAGNYLREIEQGALRASALTQQLLTFAKGGDPLRTTVSLPDIVREAAEFVLHGTSARCDYNVVPGLWNANVDKDQITQVVQNIVLNSVQAMPHGGVIRVSLVNDEIAPGSKAAFTAGRYVKLVIADSGVGIRPDILPRIFDPYFSTKKPGSGLGLATVYSIIKKHQGHIDVDSTPGQGTTFTLWLPAADTSSAEPPPAPALAPVTAAAPVRTARVLLMDDEESIRQLGATLLQRMGLEVTVVAEGAAAAREFSDARRDGRPFDLVILDLTVPGGMGGRETLEAIRRMDARVPAIVSSGYSSDVMLADFRSLGFQAMVAKPYEIDQLTGTVKQVLAQRA